MAVTLDPVLLAAQNNMERLPIVKMFSTTYLPEIPFDGSIFNPDFTENEVAPNMIRLSDDSLAILYSEPRYDRVYFMRSDADKLQFTQPVVIYDSVLGGQTPCMVELPNGNIGVILVGGTDGLIRRMVITPAGEVVTALSTIQDWSTSYTISGGTVVKLANGTYMAAIGILNESTGVWSIGRYASADFLTWGAISYFSLPGLADDREKLNPCLYQASTGALVLAIEYASFENENGQIITNIFTFLSNDNGATWAAGDQVTDYTDLAQDAKYPSIAEKSDGDIILSYTEEETVRFIDSDSVGYLAASGGEVIYDDLYPTEMHYDPATGLLHVLNSYNSTGTKHIVGLLTIDVATWTIQKAVTNHTVPAFSDIYTANHIWSDKWKSDGQYICFGIYKGFHFAVYDSVSDTITQYSFKESVTYGLDANIKGGPVMTEDCRYSQDECVLMAGQVVASEHRLYLLLATNYAYCAAGIVGYIDLTEAADPITGEYTFHEIWRQGYYDIRAVVEQAPTHFLVVPEADYLFVSCYDELAETSGYYGGLWIIQLSTLQTITAMNYITHSAFHKSGMCRLCYANGHLYGSFMYLEDFGQGDRHGLMDVNVETLSVSYHRPTYASLDTYRLTGKIATPDGRIIISTATDYGVVIFDPLSQAWTYYNEETVPGISRGGLLGFYSVAYDDANDTIFSGAYWTHSYQTGSYVAAFNESGAFQQSKYYEAALIAGGEYAFADEPSNLTLYSYDSDASVVFDENDNLWAVWQNRDVEKKSIMWDSETQSPELTTRLLSGTPIEITWEITSPNKLTFSLADGHLFDPENALSTLSTAVRKGRIIEISFGENIGGVPYWQEQGKFLVTENRVSYAKGSAPTISVTAEDRRTLWDHMNIAATEDYSSAMPDDILIDLLQEHLGLSASNYDVPEFVNEHQCFIQWIDQSFADIVKSLCDHFGYFSYVDVSDRVTFRKVDLDRATNDNEYPAPVIIDFSPQDNYSNFINQVVVNGESHETIEVIYAAEAIKTLNGTVGWWGGEKKVKVWYSEDKSRSCLNPRLEIHQSVKDYKFFMGLFDGFGSEGIVGEDDLHQWCEVQTKMPNLTGYVTGELTGVLIAAYMATTCDEEYNCGMFVCLTSLLLSGLIETISGVAMYNYTVWANPVGHEKQQISAKADDTDLQTAMNGQVISQKIDDPLCYEISQCKMVAEYELGIARTQRKTVQIAKTAHLQDEIGDIVGFQHPYTHQDIRGFIVGLTRSYLRPEDPIGESGHFTDTVNMWRV
ncbi:MAG: hypothetical protein RBQ87_01315 [Candidatus Cloacimonadaceae bacterium]|jgi:hypothetical protein|nr:hypothetical protein [Candidatus Cloacimonadaceae bacterium]